MRYGGIQLQSCYLLYQSHVINKQHSNDLLLISRFTKQFPSNDFHKHFICLKLLIKLYILLCMFHFKLIYNCVSNKCFFILKLFYQTNAFNPFYRLTSSRSFLRQKSCSKGFTKLILCFYIVNCMPIYVQLYKKCLKDLGRLSALFPFHRWDVVWWVSGIRPKVV